MLDQLVPAAGAGLVACAAGRSLAGLARPIRWWPLGLLAIGVELGLVGLAGASAPWLHWVWVASLVAALEEVSERVLTAGVAVWAFTAVFAARRCRVVRLTFG